MYLNTMQNNPKSDSSKRNFGFENVEPEEHKTRVAEVFSSVAENYDLMNDLMSFGLHRLWKTFLIQKLNPRPYMRLADIASGTGDIAFRMRDYVEKKEKNKEAFKPIMICDPNTSMLERAKSRAIDRGYLSGFHFLTAAAEDLPFDDRSFDGATISFGLRNVTDRQAAISNFFRMMDFGGHFLCLEFSPEVLPALKPLYDRYSMHFLPWLGDKIASDAGSYRYLAESIRRFPNPEALAKEFENEGFSNISWYELSGGIVTVHSAWRA